MEEKRTAKELFVIHKSGLPIAHLGTGLVEIDDALFGGLLSAIENVGVSLGLEGDGALDAIRFRAYELLYARTQNGIIVLLTNEESTDFYSMATGELQAIGDEIEKRGLLEGMSERTPERMKALEEIISTRARNIFAQQDDVFFWDDEHTFQLADNKNDRWDGEKLFSNYLMLSPLIDTFPVPVEDLRTICDMLDLKRSTSEIVNHPGLKTKSPETIEEAMRLLHTFGVIHCFSSAIHR